MAWAGVGCLSCLLCSYFVRAVTITSENQPPLFARAPRGGLPGVMAAEAAAIAAALLAPLLVAVFTLGMAEVFAETLELVG